MRKAALLSGPIIFFFITHLVESNGGAALGLLAWMLIWWIFESVVVYITALLPLLVLPLSGVMPMDLAAQSYGSKIIFLFLGGFMLAAALEKHQVHRQIALRLLSFSGETPRQIQAALMITTSLMSMWMSNTATVLMMMPIALAAMSHLGDRGQILRKPVLLGIAYAGSLGGMATLVGSPPNMALAGFLENRYGKSISFTQWLIVGFPIAFFLLFIFYIILIYFIYRKEFAQGSLRAVPGNSFTALVFPWNAAQKRILILMASVIILWLIREFIPIQGLTDHAIALAGGIALFIIKNPQKKNETLLTWDDSKNLPWGILLLFGGGLSMAQGLEKAGVISDLGEIVIASGIQSPLIYLVVFTALGLIMTEFMSNVALVNVLVPMLFGFSDHLGLSPLYFGLSVTLAASCAFMFPIATPPNAVVYSTGSVPIKDMVKIGLWMNLASIIIIITYTEIIQRLQLLPAIF